MQSVVTANQATRTNGKKRHVRGHRQPNSPSSTVNLPLVKNKRLSVRTVFDGRFPCGGRVVVVGGGGVASMQFYPLATVYSEWYLSHGNRLGQKDLYHFLREVLFLRACG